MAQDIYAKPILLITGAMAAGKSSVAQELAQRMDQSVHIRGDIFRRMVVNGRVDMSATPNREAMQQLELRYRAAADTAKLYSKAGFSVIYQDVIIGPALTDVIAMYDGLPLHVVVLCPSPESIAVRDNARAKTGYGEITVEQLQNALDNTPRLGFWVDTSDQSVNETASAILENLSKAKIMSM
jgi:chloramphenicol 3-O-phosphotransferase